MREQLCYPHGRIIFRISFEHNEFEVSVENSSWEFKKIFGNFRLDLRKEVRVKDLGIHLCVSII